MRLSKAFATAVLLVTSSVVHAQDSELTLGASAFGAHCALCHGDDGKGGGEIADLFKVPPSDLTKLSAEADGRFPFVEMYYLLARGMEAL